MTRIKYGTAVHEYFFVGADSTLQVPVWPPKRDISPRRAKRRKEEILPRGTRSTSMKTKVKQQSNHEGTKAQREKEKGLTTNYTSKKTFKKKTFSRRFQGFIPPLEKGGCVVVSAFICVHLRFQIFFFFPLCLCGKNIFLGTARRAPTSHAKCCFICVPCGKGLSFWPGDSPESTSSRCSARNSWDSPLHKKIPCGFNRRGFVVAVDCLPTQLNTSGRRRLRAGSR